MENKNEQMIQGMTPNTFVGLMNILFIVPSIGWIISIVFWAIGKDQSEYVNAKGKDLLNWFISFVIYCIAGGILGGILTVMLPALGAIFFFIFFGAVGLAAVILPIIAGIKGFNGEDWKYPFTIQLIK